MTSPVLARLDRLFVAENAHELDRLKSLVARVSDDQLATMVNEYWSVAGVLGHMAFWDGRALFLARKLGRGEPFSPSDEKPEDVDWINDSSRPLIHAVAPRVMAKLAVAIAQKTDDVLASVGADALGRLDESSPLNPMRAGHRGDHLAEIEAALERRARR